MNIRPIKMLKSILGISNTQPVSYPPDFEQFHIDIIKKVKPFSMTTNERLFGLIEAVKYVVKNDIPGDFVECGVWRGGSMMAIAETLLQLGVTDRRLFLYDTFSGMTEPTEKDYDVFKKTASGLMIDHESKKDESIIWAISSLSEVKKNISLIKYPSENITFVEGDILKTVPKNSPEKIALLRLDTDWYESTKHEMIHLYPLLTEKGILIIDDYGHWKGSREAVNEYIKEHDLKLLLNRMDDTGRCAIKI